MKITGKVTTILAVLLVMSITDIPLPEIPYLPVETELVSEAQAILGVRRRTRRRTAVVAYSAGAATAASASTAAASSQQQAAASQQQAAAAEQEAAAAKQEAAVAQQQLAASQATSSGLPFGAMVEKLPEGCTPFTFGNTQYQKCGSDFYRTAFQGNKLVYVVTEKPH